MLKRIFNKFLSFGDLEITSREELKFFRNLDCAALLYNELNQDLRELITPYLPYSKSQLAQDLFAIAFSKNKDSNFFVEFGATDGVNLSNTWLLENKLGWDGILAEPAKIWHQNLESNRNCNIDKGCVAKESGLTYSFLEVKDDSYLSSPSISSLEKFANNGDWASKLRKNNSIKYEVETISLEDLLKKYNAPKEIEFLSIDTEGSELEILKGYNFSNRKINKICVEHNYVKKHRKLLNKLLLEKGYIQVFDKVSKFDDWYILKQEYEKFQN